MKKKVDLRIVKTKASLYRGLLNLMKNKTFEEIKISEICSTSLINRSTFYDHFNDKYELLQSLIADMQVELSSSLNVKVTSSNMKEYYGEILKELLNHIQENIDVYSAVIKINSSSIARDMMTEAIVVSATKEIDDKFSNFVNIPSKTIALFYASGFINVIIDALKDPYSFDPESILNTLLLFIPDSV